MNAESNPSRAIKSRSEFLDAAHELFAGLPQSKARDLYLVDADFSSWPLDQVAVVDALTAWVRLPGRRLRLVGSRFDVLERDQSRFARWRRNFAHALECLSPTDVEPGDMPCLLLLPGLAGIELLDRERWYGRRADDRRALVAYQERVNELCQRCESAWPVTVLGL